MSNHLAPDEARSVPDDKYFKTIILISSKLAGFADVN